MTWNAIGSSKVIIRMYLPINNNKPVYTMCTVSVYVLVAIVQLLELPHFISISNEKTTTTLLINYTRTEIKEL